MSVMYMYNSLVQSEDPLSARSLAAASGIKGQQICIITKTVSYHHLETLHNCRKRLVERSWKTSLKYRYVTPHSENKGAESQAQTETISDQPLLHPHPHAHRGGSAGGAGG